MKTNKTICTVVTEKDYDLKVVRLLDGDKNQICAALFSFRDGLKH